MAVNQLKYSEEFEKGKKAGLSETQAHARATRLATVKKPAAKKKVTTRKGKKFSKEGLLKRTRRRLRELFYGGKTYLPKKKKTTRTKTIEKGLKTAGLTDAEIRKLRRKR